MNPITLEWLQKAEGDFITAGRELRARKFPNYDAVCFHSQQSVEKFLKAFLQENKQTIPRTHILADLLTLCAKIDPTFYTIQQDVNVIEGYATQFRYPGNFAERIDARQAYKIVRALRGFILSRFSEPTDLIL